MRNKIGAVFAVAIGLLFACSQVWSHHGSAAFDAGKQVMMKGTVTQWVWANPHCFLSYDANLGLRLSSPLRAFLLSRLCKGAVTTVPQ